MDISVEAARYLKQAGLLDGPLVPAGGIANQVWMTPEHVIRLNEGRFRDAFRYESEVLARLPESIPHPRVIAMGEREAGGEYLILERLPGLPLGEAWEALSTEQRRARTHELAGMIRELHGIDLETLPPNPWVGDAMAGKFADAYHAPPSLAPALIESARKRRPDATEVLDRTSAFVAERMGAFAGDTDVLLHSDLHVNNVIVDGKRISGLIDFEGIRVGPADVELDMLLRSIGWSVGRLPDIEQVPGWFRDVYPELFEHPRLIERLEVYELLWQVVQLHHWQPGMKWDDPVSLMEPVLAGVFRSRISLLLS